MTETISIGDAVEVLLVSIEPPAGGLSEMEITDQRVSGISERWIPATVCSVDDHSIGVVFADSQRRMVERGRGLLRRS